MFISRSSLWSNLDCADADKTRVYLKRSGSSPINLQLRRGAGLSLLDLFVQMTPQVIGRLKFLSIDAQPEDLQAITGHLSHPVPLLERLALDGGSLQEPQQIAPTAFNGDFPSLRFLRLQCVRTELPWRSMVNLTSFALHYCLAGNFGQLLEFFESAPRLRQINLFLTTLTSGGENGRLVSLDHLKRMDIVRCGPTSILLDHLVIPVGVKLAIELDSFEFIIEDYIPRSLDNLKNLSNFTKIELYLREFVPRVRFSGPSGQLCMTVGGIDTTSHVFESLARFDILKIEWLKVDSTIPLSRNPHRTFFSMKNLRTLVLSRCNGLRAIVDILNPNTSPSEEVACPSLEELIFIFHVWGKDFEDDVEEEFDTQNVIEMTAARASRGAKLKTVKDQAELDPVDVLELGKHVLHVECGPWVVCNDASEYSSEED